jgi:hypothetical protein
MRLASIERVGPALWICRELTAVGNRLGFLEMRADFEAALAAKMADANCTLLTDAPFQAMQSIAWQAKRNATDVDLDDEIEDVA